jgi:hypothetical protein
LTPQWLQMQKTRVRFAGSRPSPATSRGGRNLLLSISAPRRMQNPGRLAPDCRMVSESPWAACGVKVAAARSAAVERAKGSRRFRPRRGALGRPPRRVAGPAWALLDPGEGRGSSSTAAATPVPAASSSSSLRLGMTSTSTSSQRATGRG